MRLSLRPSGAGGRWLWIGAGVAALIALAGWRIAAGDEAREPEPRREAARPNAAAVAGATVLTVDADDQRRSGLRTQVLPPARAVGTVEAYATVLDVGPLADLATAFVNARSQLEAAQAKLAASRAAYARAKSLYHDDQTTSLGQLQSAEAAFRADQAAVAAASAQLRGAAASARLQFGPVLGGAPSGQLVESLVQRRTVLLQVAEPAGAPPPPMLPVQDAQGISVEARYVSPAVRADPKIQAASDYYVAAASPRLAAGLTLVAQWPTGHAQTAVILPAGALVIWQGQSWAYVRTGPQTFRREAVATDLPVAGGYLVGGLRPGTEVVTSGAPLLLSEETRPAKRAGGEEEDAD